MRDQCCYRFRLILDLLLISLYFPAVSGGWATVYNADQYLPGLTKNDELFPLSVFTGSIFYFLFYSTGHKIKFLNGVWQSGIRIKNTFSFNLDSFDMISKTCYYLFNIKFDFTTPQETVKKFFSLVHIFPHSLKPSMHMSYSKKTNPIRRLSMMKT